jgi:hypothetical protein
MSMQFLRANRMMFLKYMLLTCIAVHLLYCCISIHTGVVLPFFLQLFLCSAPTSHDCRVDKSVTGLQDGATISIPWLRAQYVKLGWRGWLMVLATKYIFYCKRAILFLSSSKILVPHPPLRLSAFVAGGGQTRQAERGMGGQYFGRR